ncbi:hypothetical protein OC834_002058 [Tilletia horrida]|nr:hypothetical protein OC834_002058 [Tilletia horrida]
MTDLPSTVPDAVADTKRLKLKTLSSTLHILVSVEPWTNQDARLRGVLGRDRHKTAASLELDLQPGAGDGLYTKKRRRGKRLNQLCASTAHLLTLQRVLELVLIFFGVHLEGTGGLQCDHAHGFSKKYCSLTYPQDQVSDIVFSREPRLTPNESATPTIPDDLFQHFTPLQMCQPLWDFVDPVGNENCVVYVRLTGRPRARPGLAQRVLQRLLQAFGKKGKAQGKQSDHAHAVPTTGSEKRRRNDDDEPAAETSSRATKRHVPNGSDAAEGEAGSVQFEQPFEAGKPTQKSFRTRLKDWGAGEVCAVLGEQTIVEAAHLLPKRLNDHELAQEALEAVFDVQSTPEPTPGQLHCMPLFARHVLPIPKELVSMYDDEYLGLLLSVQLHKLMDTDYSLMMLCGASVLLGLPTTRTQLACFQPACPTIWYNREDEFDWDDMHQRQLQHEKEVRPRLGHHVPVHKWAALHLHAALSFFQHCMKHCEGTQELIQTLMNDAGPAGEVTSASNEARIELKESIDRPTPATPTSSLASRKAGQPLSASFEHREAESIVNDLLGQYRELQAAFEDDEDDDGGEVLKFHDDITAIIALCTLTTCSGPKLPSSAATTSTLSS